MVDGFVNRRAVLERYGLGLGTFYRLRNHSDPAKRFPEPVLILGTPLWSLDDLRAFEKRNPDVLPSATKGLIPRSEVMTRYGLSRMSMSRLRAHPDPDRRLPDPVMVLGKPMWALKELREFEKRQRALARKARQPKRPSEPVRRPKQATSEPDVERT